MNNGALQCPTRAAEPVLAAVSAEVKGCCEGWLLALELLVAVLNSPDASWHFLGRLGSAPVVCALTGMGGGKLG